MIQTKIIPLKNEKPQFSFSAIKFARNFESIKFYNAHARILVVGEKNTSLSLSCANLFHFEILLSKQFYLLKIDK